MLRLRAEPPQAFNIVVQLRHGQPGGSRVISTQASQHNPAAF
jgi:hypothetical protein